MEFTTMHPSDNDAMITEAHEEHLRSKFAGNPRGIWGSDKAGHWVGENALGELNSIQYITIRLMQKGYIQ
jgi:hypothetical protein